MSARRSTVLAAVAAILAILLWWLSRGTAEVLPPATDPPVDGSVERVVTTTWMLLAATLAAGISMVFATLAILSAGRSQRR